MLIKTKDEWIGSMRDVSLLPNSPVQQKNGTWKIVDRLAAWKEEGPRIFDEYLDRFHELAVKIFREKDPQFELDPKNRFAARTQGKVFSQSPILRKGIAETLALLGSFPKLLTSVSEGKAESTSTLVVREILKGSDWVIWASLNDHLPMFAEAAPEEFLRIVEDALAQNPSPFCQVFAQEGVGIMGRNYMTGLIWALEILAWSPEHLTRVIVLLGQLASIDPGGNWANRPSNSLVDILLPWHPQTVADIPRRLAAVRTLINEEPEVAWKILLALLPRAHSVTSGTQKPTWRGFIPEHWKDTVTTKDYWDQVIAYSNMAIDIAVDNRPKLIELIEQIPAIPDPPRTRLLDYLQCEQVVSLSEHERQPLWEGLAKLASVHRQYADAEWAMDSPSVTKIEKIAIKLEPQSPSVRNRRLFSGLDFELYEEKDDDYKAQELKLELRREQAVNEILHDSGIQSVITFAESVSSPIKVGVALGVIGDETIDSVILPDLLDKAPLQDFVSGFVWSRVHTKGWQWVDALRTDDWSERQKVSLLTKLPFRREAWERAARLLLGKTSRYWTEIFPNPYHVADEDLVSAAELLLENERPRAAIQCLQRLVFMNKQISPSLVARALMSGISSQERRAQFDHHATRKLIKWLQDNPSTTETELFQVEWSYLPLLDRLFGGVAPKTLEGRLARDPSFFCEVIQTIFRSDKENRAKSDISEDKKKIAENAYRLLYEWGTPPGTTLDGKWNSDAFREWLAAVKKATYESGHYRVAMSQLGQVLPYAPPDPSGLWIHRTVADALNSKDAGDMRSGFTCELFNMRGTYTLTAGKEEREIAARNRQKAEAVENAGYHRFAAALRELAAWYEKDAEREASRSLTDD